MSPALFLDNELDDWNQRLLDLAVALHNDLIHGKSVMSFVVGCNVSLSCSCRQRFWELVEECGL